MNESSEVFETLSDAISYVFRQEQTSLLSLDRICEVLSNPRLYIKIKKQIVPCSSIARRRISSTLSSSDLFVRAGPPRTCLWAIQPHNPLFVSDAAISSSIEQMLAANGPMTLSEIVNSTELSGVDVKLFEKFLNEHETEFSMSEDKRYWFTNQPRPVRQNFDSICLALIYAFGMFPKGASVEELHWFLCLSTVGGKKAITRRCVSRELSRRQDLFLHLSRARYNLIRQRNQNIEEEKQNEIEQQNPIIRTFPEQEHNIMQPGSTPMYFTIPQVQVSQIPQSCSFKNSFQQNQFFDNDIGDDVDHVSNPNDDESFDPYNFFSHDFQFSFD